MLLFANLNWTTPALLGGLALLALPLIAHLLNRKSRQKYIVPTLMFLQQCVTHQSSFFRFRRWLLLLLRAVVVALIVAGFARPFWLAGASSVKDSENGTAMAIVIDQSLSTHQLSNGSSLYRQMIGAANRALDELSPGRDVASIVMAGHDSEPMFQQLSPNLPELKNRLSATEPTFERADLTGAISLAAGQLRTHAGSRILIIVSDMQKTNWEQTLVSARQSITLPPDTEVKFVSLKHGARENFALSRPVCSPPDPIDGQPCQFSVQLANHSNTTKQIPVKLTAGSQSTAAELGNQTLQLGPGESGSVSFKTQYQESLGKQFVFQTGGDSMPADDRSFLALHSSEQTRVAVITDDPLAELGTSSFFLQRALEPFRDKGDRFVATTFAPKFAADQLTNDSFQIACVGYVSSWSDSSATALVQFAKNGGHVVYLCGEGNVAAGMEAVESSAGEDFFPLQLDGLERFENFDDFPFIAAGKWRSPWLRDFDIQSQMSLQRIRFQKLWRVRKTLDDAEVLLNYSDGRPAVATRRFGGGQRHGQIVLLNFSPSVEFSEVGRYGSFVALIQMLLRQLRDVEEGTDQAFVGRTLSIPIPANENLDPSQISIVGPTDKPVRISVAETGNGPLVTIADSSTPGFYRVILNADKDYTLAVAALNTDPRESDLAAIDLSDVDQSFEESVGEIAGTNFRSELIDDGQPLWGWMLVGALVAIILESSFLGWWRS